MSFAVLQIWGCIATAQFNLGFKEPADPLVVFVDGQELSMPTVGGINTPQFSSIDLDLDGILDLFLFDRSHDVIRTFVYDPDLGEYLYDPSFESAFPTDLQEFALLRDFDCDGKQDIFTYHEAGFRVYQNVSTSEQLIFQKMTDKVRSDYGSFVTGIFVLAGDIPAIVDVDNDGDLDILTFGTVNSESTIEYHRNVSMDLYGSCDSLEFEVVTQCWGKVEEPVNSSSLSFFDCQNRNDENQRGGLHPGSSVLLIDTDNDLDKDLIVGDIQSNEVVFGINTGTAQESLIDVNQQTHDFPNAIDPVKMQYLIAGYEVDIDHDGIQDLLMSVNNSIDSSVNTEHVWYYRNASSGSVDYQLQSKTFLLDEMIDIGSNSAPVSLDVNGDGRMDLIVVNDYRRSPNGSSNSRLYYFEQQANGSFVLADQDFSDLSSLNLKGLNISLGDIDSDGDLDMIAGDADGFVHLFINTPQGGVVDFNLSAPQYMGISTIGSNAAPLFADVNGDDLLDLVIGERIGILSYFENTGSPTSAQFSSSPTIENFGQIDVSEDCCVGHAVPRWIEHPSLGFGRFLLVGSDEKRIDIYEVSENLNVVFPKRDMLFLNASRISPELADINNDGIFELICGSGEGGLKYYNRDKNYRIGISDAYNEIGIGFKLFPNPAGDDFTMAFDESFSGEVLIYDLVGSVKRQERVVARKEIRFDSDGLPNGIYIVETNQNGQRKRQSLSILHGL